MKKAVQFGAGNIGRGFLAQLFNESGYEVVFIDIDKNLISLLNKRAFYYLDIIGDRPCRIRIDNVRGIDARDIEKVADEVRGAEVIATAVGARALKEVSFPIRLGIARRRDAGITSPLNIIICENLLHARNVLKSYVLDGMKEGHRRYLEEYIGFVEAVVSRMIPVMTQEDRKEDLLLLRAEEYGILPVDKRGFKGKTLKIKGMVAHDNFTALVEQKLFIHNLGHAIFAYLGYLEGYRFIWEAVEDKRIKGIVEGALRESGEALNKKYGFTPEEQKAHIGDLIKRFSNKALGDTVFRVGRDPIRKLGPDERLTGAARLALEYKILPKNISSGIAAALCYDYPEDKDALRLQEDLKAKGVDWVLEHICGLKQDSELTRMIKQKRDRSEK